MYGEANARFVISSQTATSWSGLIRCRNYWPWPAKRRKQNSVLVSIFSWALLFIPKVAAFITKLSRQFGEVRNKLHWYHLNHNKLRTKPSQPENDPYDPPGAPWENGRGYPGQQ
jgi:hypothetical protein